VEVTTVEVTMVEDTTMEEATTMEEVTITEEEATTEEEEVEVTAITDAATEVTMAAEGVARTQEKLFRLSLVTKTI
uniref:hypothetical protein n=1 Tax=Shewanella litoralis TaxID=2282700 RepID=UPI00197E1097